MKNVQILIKKAGWSQTELANRTGIARPNLNNYLNGKITPSVDSVGLIAEAFGVNVSELFNTDEVPEPRVEKLPEAIQKAIKNENVKLTQELIQRLAPIFSKLQREEGVEEIIIKEVPREKLSQFINAWLRDPGLSADFYKLLDEGADDELLRNEFMREVAVGQLSAGGTVAKKARKLLKETLDDKSL
jgi:transcriptional regulator with XRE-family HTH domain